MQQVEVDHLGRAAELGQLLGGLAGKRAPAEPKLGADELRRLKTEVEIAASDGAFEKGIMDWGDPAVFTCAECHGALVQLEEGPIVRFRCHTGHAYTARRRGRR